MLAVTRRVRPQALNALRGMASKAKASEEVSIESNTGTTRVRRHPIAEESSKSRLSGHPLVQ
jgi:hypothetical protein